MTNQKPKIEIYTIQIGQWRLLSNTGITMMDITAKSGWKSFAPDYGLVMEYKKGLVSEEEYTKLYIERLKYIQDRMDADWEELKRSKKIAFACYCKAGDFCHRHIFKQCAEDYLVEQGFEVEQKGELTKEK